MGVPVKKYLSQYRVGEIPLKSTGAGKSLPKTRYFKAR
jgi:hypothetical protein